jgi:periplasmic protein TonB
MRVELRARAKFFWPRDALEKQPALRDIIWRTAMNNGLLVENQFLAVTKDLHALRFLVTLPAALMMTLCLIWGMEWIIRPDGNLTMPPVVEYKMPNPILKPVDPAPLVRNKPEPPKPVEQPPEMIIDEPTVDSDGGGIIEIVEYTPTDLPTTLGNISSNMPIPNVMIQPNYPSIALSKGYEGYVDVQFDVATTGATENIVAVAANPPKIFDREALKAVAKWKFSPIMVDGKAQKYIGMVQRIVFELAD